MPLPRLAVLPALTRAGLGAALAVALLAAVPAAAEAAPSNDDFANATVIAPAGAHRTGTTAEATVEPGEPNHAESPYGEPFHSIWYSWTAPSDGAASLETCGSAFDTRVGVYTGEAVGSLTSVAGADDSLGDGACSDTGWAGVSWPVTGGTTYRIAVDTNGGITDDGQPVLTNTTTGPVELTLSGPAGEVDPDAIREKPVEVKVPDFMPHCTRPGAAEKCDLSRLRFRLLRHVRAWVASVQEKGGDVTLRISPKPSSGYDGSVAKYLQSARASGGEIVQQSLKPGTTFVTTVGEPVSLKVGYFEPAEDEKIRQAVLEALAAAGEGKKNVKSPCEFIDTNATPDQIETKLASLLDSAYLTQRRAGEILAKFGCRYEVGEYVEAPGSPVDFVRNVTGVDRRRDLIQLEVALPVRQDLLLVLREDPARIDTGVLGLGMDGRLTASRTQFNEVTIQVVERLTGRLVQNADVSFVGPGGEPETKKTDEHGEVWFASGLLRPDRFAIVARYADSGASLVGYRSVDVVDRAGAAWVTMTGREMTGTVSGGWTSSQADVDRSRSLEVVPASLGTGLSGPPSATPTIEQSTVAYPNGDGAWTVGDYNSVRVADDTNFAVGAAPGLVTIGGGLGAASAARGAGTQRMGWSNPFQALADAVNSVVTGLSRAFAQGPSAPGRAEEVASQAQQQQVASSAQAYADNGAAVPQSSLISDKGLGIISDNGGGLIGEAGGNVISVGGLNLVGPDGQLLGQAGGNLISRDGAGVIANDGASVIANDGASMMPVAGGPLIGQAGGN